MPFYYKIGAKNSKYIFFLRPNISYIPRIAKCAKRLLNHFNKISSIAHRVAQLGQRLRRLNPSSAKLFTKFILNIQLFKRVFVIDQ